MQVLKNRGEALRTIGAHGTASRPLFMWQVLGVLVIGAMLAHWAWVLFAPRSAAVLPAMQAASEFQAEHLFGIVPASAASSAMPNVRLVGVFAGKPGFAVLELDGKRQMGLATGAEIVAGSRLVEVAIDHVVVERSGVRQQIDMPKKISGNAVVTPVLPATSR